MTSIASDAFYGCSGMMSVKVPATDFPAFCRVVSLVKSNLGKPIIMIDADGNEITDYSIPQGVNSIDDYTFYNCSGLRSVTIPNSVTSIGKRAFDFCNSLESVTIGTGVLLINPNSFSTHRPAKVIWLTNTPPSGYSNAAGTINYVANDLYTSLSNKTVYKYLSSMFEVGGVKYVPVSPSERTCDAIDCLYDKNAENIHIGETVTNAGITLKVNRTLPYICYGNPCIKEVHLDIKGDVVDYAFSSCTALQTIILGVNVTGLGTYAFSGCSKMEGIIIPNSVTTIGRSAFQNCSSLLKMTIPQSVTKINNYAFYGCTNLKDVYIADRNAILTLGSNGSSSLFSSCPLDSVYIGGNISYNTDSSSGYSPFYRNTSLRSVTITDEETEISENEFYGCTNLKNVSIGDGVTTIGKWAFSGCSSLDYFAFGSSVTSIGQEAFSDCTAMTRLISHAATPPTCGSQALEDINIWTCKLEVPIGNAGAYAVADQWKDFLFVNEVDATGISTSLRNRERGNEEVYDLQGRRVKTVKKGLYIKDGKTVVIK